MKQLKEELQVSSFKTYTGIENALMEKKKRRYKLTYG